MRFRISNVDPSLQNDPLNFSQVSKTTGPLVVPATSCPTEPVPHYSYLCNKSVTVWHYYWLYGLTLSEIIMAMIESCSRFN